MEDTQEKYNHLKYEMLRSSRNFPWRWYGDIPKSGQPHSYLCTILLPLFKQEYRHFISGKPTFRELTRLAENMSREEYDPVLDEVVKYCRALYDKSNWDRSSVEREVFEFLKYNKSFKEDFESKLRKSLGLEKA